MSDEPNIANADTSRTNPAIIEVAPFEVAPFEAATLENADTDARKPAVTIPAQPGARDAHPAAPPAVRVCEVELSEPITGIAAGTGADGRPYARARVLVRLHGEPLATIDAAFGDGDITAEWLLAEIDACVTEPLDRHLAADGIARPAALALSGLAAGSKCHRRPRLPAEPPLATVVVTFTLGAESLSRCLDSVLAGDYPNFEVLVIDTRPREGTVEALLKERYAGESRVRLVQEPRPGMSQARNTGLLFARGDLVAFIGDDVRADPGWLRALVAEFEADPTVACAAGMVQPALLETAAQAYADGHRGLNKTFARRVLSAAAGDPAAPQRRELGLFGIGSNLAVRRSLLGDLWGFDVALGAGSLSQGGEDVDAFLDLLFAGHRVVYQPQALAWQYQQGSYEDLMQQMRSYGVGIGAVLTKRLLTSPRHIGQVLRTVPVAHRGPPPGRPAGQPAEGEPSAGEYPPELAKQELRGIVGGPLAYIYSRLRIAWLSA